MAGGLLGSSPSCVSAPPGAEPSSGAGAFERRRAERSPQVFRECEELIALGGNVHVPISRAFVLTRSQAKRSAANELIELMDFIDVLGESGARYRFRAYRADVAPPPMAGHYVVVQAGSLPGSVVLIGVTTDLSRLPVEIAAGKYPGEVFTRLNVSRSVRIVEHADIVAGHKGIQVEDRDL